MLSGRFFISAQGEGIENSVQLSVSVLLPYDAHHSYRSSRGVFETGCNNWEPTNGNGLKLLSVSVLVVISVTLRLDWTCQAVSTEVGLAASDNASYHYRWLQSSSYNTTHIWSRDPTTSPQRPLQQPRKVADSGKVVLDA